MERTSRVPSIPGTLGLLVSSAARRSKCGSPEETCPSAVFPPPPLPPPPPSPPPPSLPPSPPSPSSPPSPYPTPSPLPPSSNALIASTRVRNSELLQDLVYSETYIRSVGREMAGETKLSEKEWVEKRTKEEKEEERARLEGGDKGLRGGGTTKE
uniref:Uncharacterized protein n=1 Tax=Vespula pensylvanica TaxID=30213 RepID=A0A834PAJ1_VESPE|nr:hypothetical protein H0235_002649 [Vespula pensylvanica]